MPDGINLESYTACNGSEVRFSPLQALSTTANTPYIAEITSCDEKTFSAQEAIVKISSDKEDIKHEGDLVFKGTLTEFAPGEAEGLYILKPTGEGFIKGGAKTTIPAFRAYISGPYCCYKCRKWNCSKRPQSLYKQRQVNHHHRQRNAGRNIQYRRKNN